jgi:hypothetical protein
VRKTAQTIEEANAASDGSQIKAPSMRKGRKGHKHPNSIKNLKPYVPGQSGNPGGRPKNDIAAEIARAIFANDGEAIYKAFAKSLRTGNAYAYSVLADRGFGKLKEKIEHSADAEMLAALESGRKRTKNDDDSAKPATPPSEGNQ